eukprot:scaffold317762_cov18-Tisochrysis_lutea.AAC.1
MDVQTQGSHPGSIHHPNGSVSASHVESTIFRAQWAKGRTSNAGRAQHSTSRGIHFEAKSRTISYLTRDKCVVKDPGGRISICSKGISSLRLLSAAPFIL